MASEIGHKVYNFLGEMIVLINQLLMVRSSSDWFVGQFPLGQAQENLKEY